MSLFSSKSKSSQNISRDRALSDPEAPAPTKNESVTPTTHHTFQVTSKDNVPVHPKPELPAVPTTKATSGDVVLTISKAENKVKEYRDVEVHNGNVTVTDFPVTIIPQTVQFTSISDPSTKVLTQILKKRDGKEAGSAFYFLREHFGQVITVNNPSHQIHVTGVLRGANSDSLYVSTQEAVKSVEGEASGSGARDTGVVMIPILTDSFYTFPNLPASTFTTNLEWTLSSKAEKHFAEISYAFSGVGWTLAFNGQVDAAFSTLHLTGWYQLDNKSGTDFNAKVIIVENSAKLVEPKRTISTENPVNENTYDEGSSNNKMSSILSFKKGGNSSRAHQKKTSRRFPLPRKVRLPNGEMVLEKAVDAIFPIRRYNLVKARKTKFSGILDTEDQPLAEYVDVDQVISFENTVENGLGLTLPEGVMQVTQSSEEDDDSILDFCTTSLRLEDHMVLVKLIKLDRNQFSVLRKRTHFHHEAKKSIIRETFDITLDNNSSEPIFDLYVEENLFRWSEWEVSGYATSTSKQGSSNRPVPFTDFTCEKHELKSHRVSFHLPLVPDYTSVTITYTAVYNYNPSLAASS
eukprot:Phypoly_transcript_04783.p1 GENE.Phypoly_transcript_04783~~Phypoly_transcript_04783.p1  ORF type:complete len:576 (+),score=115.99 Phypoly_transcript_04783:248-1975(+)